MAIADFVPALTRSGQLFIHKSNRAALRIVPEKEDEAKARTQVFYLAMTSILVVGLILTLVIQTLLVQDAFALSALQKQAVLLSDQRDALENQLADVADPSHVALAAKKLGMKPGLNPTFLDLSPAEVSK
jgi:cell division protein FtsL